MREFLNCPQHRRPHIHLRNLGNHFINQWSQIHEGGKVYDLIPDTFLPVTFQNMQQWDEVEFHYKFSVNLDYFSRSAGPHICQQMQHELVNWVHLYGLQYLNDKRRELNSNYARRTFILNLSSFHVMRRVWVIPGVHTDGQVVLVEFSYETAYQEAFDNAQDAMDNHTFLIEERTDLMQRPKASKQRDVIMTTVQYYMNMFSLFG